MAPWSLITWITDLTLWILFVLFFGVILLFLLFLKSKARSEVQSHEPGNQDFPGHWFPGSLVLEGTRGQEFLVLSPQRAMGTRGQEFLVPCLLAPMALSEGTRSQAPGTK